MLLFYQISAWVFLIHMFLYVSFYCRWSLFTMELQEEFGAKLKPKNPPPTYFLKQYIFILKSNVIVLHLKEFKVSWPIAFLRCLKITLNRYPGDTVPSSLYLSYISCSKTWDAVMAFNIPSLNRKWCCKFSDVGYKLAFQSRALTKLPQLHTLILVVPV